MISPSPVAAAPPFQFFEYDPAPTIGNIISSIACLTRVDTYDGRNLIMISPSPVAAAPPFPFSA